MLKYSLNIYFEVLTGDLRIKLPLVKCKMWRDKRKVRLEGKRIFPNHNQAMQIEVRWEKKQKQKWLCNSRSMKLFESASHREPPRWEVSLFWEHKLEFKDKKTRAFLWKWWTVISFRGNIQSWVRTHAKESYSVNLERSRDLWKQ